MLQTVCQQLKKSYALRADSSISCDMYISKAILLDSQPRSGSPETTSMTTNYDNARPYSQWIIWPQNSWFMWCSTLCLLGDWLGPAGYFLGIFSIMPCFQFGNDAIWYPADRSHGSKLNIHTCSINETTMIVYFQPFFYSLYQLSQRAIYPH